MKHLLLTTIAADVQMKYPHSTLRFLSASDPMRPSSRPSFRAKTRWNGCRVQGLAVRAAFSRCRTKRERISAIVDVQFDNGSPLELGVAGSNFLPLHPPKFLLYSVDLRLCKISRRLMDIGKPRCCLSFRGLKPSFDHKMVVEIG